MTEIILICIGYALCVGVIAGEIARRLLGRPRRGWPIGTPYAKPVKPESQDGSMAEVPCARTQTQSRRSGKSENAPPIADPRKSILRKYLTGIFFTKKSPVNPNPLHMEKVYTREFSANDLPKLCSSCANCFEMARIVSPERCEACIPKRFLPPQLKLVSSRVEPRIQSAKTPRVPAKELRKPPANTTRLVTRKEIIIEKLIERACYKVQVETKRQLQRAIEYRIEQLRRDLSSKKSLTKVVSKDTIEQMGFRLQELEHLRGFIKNSVLYKRGSWK